MNSNIRIYNPKGLYKPVGLYSQVSRVRASEYIFIAGQVATDENGKIVGKNDFEAQVRQVFKNLETALNSVDCDFSNVAKFTTYITNKNDIETFRRVRTELYAAYYSDENYPPNTFLIINALAEDLYMIEVEAIAIPFIRE